MKAAHQIHPRQVTDWLHSVLPVATSRQSRAQLTADSRHIAPGDVFLAYPALQSVARSAGDGRQYIAQAIESGARAVLYDACNGYEWDTQLSIPHLAVPELRQAAGVIAHDWYERPDQGAYYPRTD